MNGEKGGIRIMESTKEKFYMAKCFWDSSRFLSRMKPLGEKERENFINNQQLKFYTTCYFLNSMIFELVIKVLYELDKSKLCDKTHNLGKIYNNLSKENQEFIEGQYNCLKRSLETKIVSPAKKQKKIDIGYCDFQRALELNQRVITDFKYDNNFFEESSVFLPCITSEEGKQRTVYLIPESCYSNFFEIIFGRIENLIDNEDDFK